MMSIASEVVDPVSISVLLLWSFQSVFSHPSILRHVLFKFHHGMNVWTLSIPSLYRLCSPPINPLAILSLKTPLSTFRRAASQALACCSGSGRHRIASQWQEPSPQTWHHKNPCKAAREYNLRRKEYEKAPHMTTLHGRSLIIII